MSDRIRPADRRRREDRYDWEKARGPILAFGETRTLAAWAKDPRCQVSRETLRTRLALGWQPERALTAAKNDQTLPPITHQGRTLTLRGWAEHTGIAYNTLYTRIHIKGMSLEEAVHQGPADDGQGAPITAFGETKPAYVWSVDPRANASSGLILKRVRSGWNPQLAITEEPDNRPRLGMGTPHEAFGKRLTIPDWARLSQILEEKIRYLMAQHSLSPEDALRSLGRLPDWMDTDTATLETIADGLRPGDVIIAITPTTTPHPHFTVRRTAHPATEH